jgi:thioesterase domain-containing protein
MQNRMHKGCFQNSPAHKEISTQKLPAKIYRRFLILTDAWIGSRAATGSLLIKVYDGGDGLPLYWCGTPDTLPSFYQEMGKDRSIYCLCGTYGVLPPTQETICSLGHYYATEIIKNQPDGPYLLGGFCEAGYVSFEIANIMQAHGYQVGMLVLFDVDVTKTDYWLLIARELFRFREKLVQRKKQFAVDPVQCIKEILANKWEQILVSPSQWVVKLFSPALLDNTPEQMPETRYKLLPYQGKVNFIYVKWGLFGYFQYKFFQRYWNAFVDAGSDFNIIPGSVHNRPSWPTVAKITNQQIKKLGL